MSFRKILQKRRAAVFSKLFVDLRTWFHIPKCGSSFVNVVAHQPGFCPGLEQNTTIDVDSFGDCFIANFTLKTCSSICDPTKLRCQGSVHECLGMHYEAF